MSVLQNKNILLIITGGIAAYKSLDLIRQLRHAGALVRCILSAGGAKFVTPLSVAALSENAVHQDLWDLTEDQGMAHIRLARAADLILVAPASANFIARTALGLADDLASTLMLANDKPVLMAPAMNGVMWAAAIVQQHVQALKQRGVMLVGPSDGAMACGEEGLGRMAEVGQIIEAAQSVLSNPYIQPVSAKPLAGLRALVTAGPTHEPIDPVRYLANRSSGKQGYALAVALRDAGAMVTLISGPVSLPPPASLRLVYVETAQEMLAAVMAEATGAGVTGKGIDIAIAAAAVADWRVAVMTEKLKKVSNDAQGLQRTLSLIENPDILEALGQAGSARPKLLIGFAAETENLQKAATAKLQRKGCDWLLANSVQQGQVFGEDENEILFLRRDAAPEHWPRMSKQAVAIKLMTYIRDVFSAKAAASSASA